MSSAASWCDKHVPFVPHAHEFAMGAPSTAAVEWPRETSARVVAAVGERQLRSVAFNLFECTDDDLVQLALEMLLDGGAARSAALNVDVGALQTLLLAIRRAYRSVPFHNFTHAFNVMQACHAFLFEAHCGALLTEHERFSLLLSCLAHDIDHPGFSNVWQKASASALAVRYNDTAILESHHCASFFALLTRADCDVFRQLPRADFVQFRAAAIELILATDLAQHKVYIDRLALLDAALLAPVATAANVADAAPTAARRLLMCALIKCADLCNEIRTHALSRRWAPLVLTEFFTQGDAEKQRGYPVGFTNDRAKVTPASSQIGFIKFLCLPLYDAVVRVVPHMEFARVNLHANLKAWEAEAEQGKAGSN
jgi:high affinity cGMP-specific 3',5'-cyclic phosphodiesterase 9